MSRIILNLMGDRIGELAGRRYPAGKNVDGTETSDHAALPCVKNGVRSVFRDKTHVDDGADIQDNHHSGESFANLGDHLSFEFGKAVRAGHIAAVLLLARRAADDDKRRIRSTGGLFEKRLVKRHFLLRPGLVAPADALVKGVLLFPCSVHLQNVRIDMHVRIFEKRIQDSGDLGHIYHAARAGSALIVMRLNPPENGHIAVLRKRESLILVSQKHDALGNRFPGKTDIFIPIQFHVFILQNRIIPIFTLYIRGGAFYSRIISQNIGRY